MGPTGAQPFEFATQVGQKLTEIGPHHGVAVRHGGFGRRLLPGGGHPTSRSGLRETGLTGQAMEQAG